MNVRPQRTPHRGPEIDHETGDAAEQIVPLLHEIHVAVGDLGSRLDRAVSDLRRELEGKRKSHYTVEEIATLTGRASYTVRAWVKQGLIRAIRVPGTGPKGRLLVPCEELQNLVGRGLGDRVPAVAID